jgi:thiosulfate/3-mercaptopyruvate sulfurtransferase
VPHTTLVSTDLLAAHLDKWVVIDCRYDLSDEAWGLVQYRAGHIPGAVHASLSHDLAGETTGTNGRHPLPPVETMAATFSRLGIGPASQVVAYDQDSGMYASRLWWMLRYLGHDAVAVLDGGWAKWQREQRPVRTDDEQHAPTPFRARPRHELRVGVDEIVRIIGTDGTLLLDARAPERFEGRTEPLDRVAGHIPGAHDCYYRNNVAADGTMLPPDVLKAQFHEALQGHDASQVVMYCGSGVSACHNLLAMEHVGVRGVKLYPGSWSEWSADPRRPVETGPARRRS